MAAIEDSSDTGSRAEKDPSATPVSPGEDPGAVSDDADSATGQVLDEDEIGDGKSTVDEPTAGVLDSDAGEPGGGEAS